MIGRNLNGTVRLLQQNARQEALALWAVLVFPASVTDRGRRNDLAMALALHRIVFDDRHCNRHARSPRSKDREADPWSERSASAVHSHVLCHRRDRVGLSLSPERMTDRLHCEACNGRQARDRGSVTSGDARRMKTGPREQGRPDPTAFRQKTMSKIAQIAEAFFQACEMGQDWTVCQGCWQFTTDKSSGLTKSLNYSMSLRQRSWSWLGTSAPR